MNDSKTISWIFLAIALASEQYPAKFSEISTIADGINHAVPTQKELQSSIKWLKEKEYIFQHGKRYELSATGKDILQSVEGNTNLMQMWSSLENVIAREFRVHNVSNNDPVILQADVIPITIFAPMKMNKWLRIFLILFILGFNIGCDQVSKSIVRRDLYPNQEISYLGKHFNLIRVENTGAFLSLGDTLGGPVHFALLVVLPVLALAFGLGYILIKTSINKYKLLGIILIIGGGVGNLYDRVMHGSVTDFMHIDFGFAQTGIFNVADMSIMAGMGIILLDAFLERKKTKTEESAKIPHSIN